MKTNALLFICFCTFLLVPTLSCGLTLHEVKSCTQCSNHDLCQNYSVEDDDVGLDNDERAVVGRNMGISDCTRVRAGTQTWHNSGNGKTYFVYDPNDYWYSSKPCPTGTQIKTARECRLAMPLFDVDQNLLEFFDVDNRPGGCFRYKTYGNKIEFNNKLGSKYEDRDFHYICRSCVQQPTLTLEKVNPFEVPYVVSPDESGFGALSATVDLSCNSCFTTNDDKNHLGVMTFVVSAATAWLPASSAISSSINAILGAAYTGKTDTELLFNEMTYENNLDKIFSIRLNYESKAAKITQLLKKIRDDYPDEPFKEDDNDFATNPRCFPNARKNIEDLVENIDLLVADLQTTLVSVLDQDPSKHNVVRGHITMRILQLLPYLIELSTAARIAYLESAIEAENDTQKWRACDLRYTHMKGTSFTKLNDLYRETKEAARKWTFEDCHRFVATQKAPHRHGWNYGFFNGKRPGRCQNSQFTRFWQKRFWTTSRFYCGSGDVTYMKPSEVDRDGSVRDTCNMKEQLVKDWFDGKFGDSSIIQHRLNIMERAHDRLQHFCQIRQMVSPDGRHTPVYYHLLSLDDCQDTNVDMGNCVLSARKYHEDEFGQGHDTDYCGIPRQDIKTKYWGTATRLPSSELVFKPNFTIPWAALEEKWKQENDQEEDSSANGVSAIYSNVLSLILSMMFLATTLLR